MNQEPNDILKLIDQHRFHNPLQPRTCYICKVEVYRAENTPLTAWSRAFSRAVRPPKVVIIMVILLALQLAIIATLLQ